MVNSKFSYKVYNVPVFVIVRLVLKGCVVVERTGTFLLPVGDQLFRSPQLQARYRDSRMFSEDRQVKGDGKNRVGESPEIGICHHIYTHPIPNRQMITVVIFLAFVVDCEHQFYRFLLPPHVHSPQLPKSLRHEHGKTPWSHL